MTDSRLQRRRALSRVVSRLSGSSVADCLAHAARAPETIAWRIGVTGAPGAGKSSLINQLLPRRVAGLGDTSEIAVIAIDPSSPRTGGALLGDRVRMDAASNDARIFIRSIASGANNDGLADNVVDLLHEIDAAGFAETILETVGVGQAEHASSALVDTLLVVMHPDAGDSIQAMKSGLAEFADIFAVNKSDLAGAKATVQEMKSILAHRRTEGDEWRPKIVPVSSRNGTGFDDLSEAIDEHRAWKAGRIDPVAVRLERRSYHLRSLLARHAMEVLATDTAGALTEPDLATSYAKLVSVIADRLPDRTGFKSTSNPGEMP